MTKTTEPPAPEFSRPVLADQIGHRETKRDIEADAAEREALARRLELEGIRSLKATLRLRRVRGEMIRVVGHLEAEVVQTSVVSLESVENRVEEEFEALFAPPELVPEHELELSVDPLGEDDPEPLEDGRVDLGELTAQHLSLALDPYPRRPDEDPVGSETVEEEPPEGTGAAALGEDEPRRNPFAALAKLRDKG
jgi:uncharacterized metal-binding protein YceD (DUF177 family)